MPDDCIQNKVRGSILYAPDNKKIVIKKKNYQALVIDRRIFDNYLIRIAEKLGAKIHTNTRVLELQKNKNNNIYGLIIKEKGVNIQVRSKIIIDGEGVQARFVRQAGLRSLKRSYILPAIQYEMSNVDINPDFVKIFFGRKVSPGFFAYIIPTSDDSARVAVATNHGRPKDYLNYFIKRHPIASKEIKKGKVDKIMAGSILIGGPIKKTYTNQFLGIGDAVGQVKPTTGGGVVLGGMCAKIAGEIAAEAIKLGDTSEKILKKYDIIWRNKFGKEFQNQRLLRRLINNIPDKMINKGFETITKNNISALIENFGDMDLQSNTLKKIIFTPKIVPLLISFVYALIFP